MSRTVPRRATVLGSAVAAASALLLVACSTPLPEPEPEPEPVTAPAALDTEQAARVLADTAAVLDAADEEEEPRLLDSRVFGPARHIRTAEYVLAEEGQELTTIPPTAQTLIVPTTTSWPRVFMAITEPPEDLRAPLLLTFVQDGPREQYRMWSWARLFPGVEMPATAQPEVGSEPVEPDDDALAMAPQEVLEAYLDVLAEGGDSDHADTFTEGPLATGIVETREAYEELVDDNGSLTETYQATQTGPYAIGAAEGDAIVVGSFRTTTAITLDDSTLTIGDETAALLGEETVESDLTITWISVVTFSVPPAGSEDPIEVLGAEHSRIDVEGE